MEEKDYTKLASALVAKAAKESGLVKIVILILKHLDAEPCREWHTDRLRAGLANMFMSGLMQLFPSWDIFPRRLTLPYLVCRMDLDIGLYEIDGVREWLTKTAREEFNLPDEEIAFLLDDTAIGDEATEDQLYSA